jgi:hypothetical protein
VGEVKNCFHLVSPALMLSPSSMRSDHTREVLPHVTAKSYRGHANLWVLPDYPQITGKPAVMGRVHVADNTLRKVRDTKTRHCILEICKVFAAIFRQKASATSTFLVRRYDFY